MPQFGHGLRHASGSPCGPFPAYYRVKPAFVHSNPGHTVKIVRYYPRAVVGDGGITNSVWCHSQELVRAGARMTIAFDGGEPPADDGIEWRRVSPAGVLPGSPAGLEDALQGADLMVLHSAWAWHNVRAGEIARQNGIPYLLEPRGAYDPRILRRKRVLKRAWWWMWERRLVHEARAVHVFWDQERPHVRALGYDGAFVVAPNGIEMPQDRAWDGGSGGYLLWIGRFDPEHKGIDLLLKAVRLLPPEERPRLRLHGPDARIGGKDAMRHLVAELGIDAWVTIGDPVYGDDKYDLLERALGFVYPSRWEGFGNSVAEAASVGLPTLTTPYPLGEWLAEHDAAFVARASPTGLAEGLRRLMSPQAAEVGARGREMISEITWDRVADSWLRQVEEILSSPVGTAR